MKKKKVIFRGMKGERIEVDLSEHKEEKRMKEKAFKLLTKVFITLAIIYWSVILLSALTGCKTMQSSVINLKEPISTGGDWIMERKDFKVYRD